MSSRSKYYPLFEYLQRQPDESLLELSFAEIERIIGRKLPATALSSRAWWSNSRSTRSQIWQKAGWLVDSVDFNGQTVTFRPARIAYRVTPVRKPQGWTGAQIKSLREFMGWTQQQMADHLQVRQQTVSDWEVGHHTTHRSMNRILQMIAEDAGFPYQTQPKEEP